MLECVVNVSEGRDRELIASIAGAAGEQLLDVHSDPHHHRTVLTTVGEDAARAVTSAAVRLLDLAGHQGAHPRIGVVDVVPFAPLGAEGLDAAVAARDRYVAWAEAELDLPCFLYGPERSLPAVRRDAFAALSPDRGPSSPHPTAGAVAVGARDLLVAYNLWLVEPDLALARRVAASVRGPSVRALGLQVGSRVQVSANLIAPSRVGPEHLFDAVARQASVARAELVGLVPEAVLSAVPPSRWAELDLAAERTIEARLAERGLG